MKLWVTAASASLQGWLGGCELASPSPESGARPLPIVWQPEEQTQRLLTPSTHIQAGHLFPW